MTLPKDAVANLFDLSGDAVPDMPPRYNVCPTVSVPVVLTHDGTRQMTLMRWGFLPGWYKKPNDGPLLINARSETVAEKPAFRAACRSRRCLLAVTGFYEWRREGKVKEPWFVAMADGAPMVMAGVWQDWQGTDAQAQGTFAILTCAANDDIAEIHHRMPVILSPEDFGLWLGEQGHGAATLMKPLPVGVLNTYRVSPRVNSGRVDDDELIAPLVT